MFEFYSVLSLLLANLSYQPKKYVGKHNLLALKKSQ